MIQLKVISPSLGTRVLKPFGKTSLKYELEEEYASNYKIKLSDITFIGEDFKFFKNIEDGENRCEELILQVYVIKSGIERMIYETTFSMSDGKWNIDTCTVTFTSENKNDDYYRYNTINQDNKYNVLEAPTIRAANYFQESIGYYLILRSNVISPEILRDWGYTMMFQRSSNQIFVIYGKEVIFCNEGVIPWGDWKKDTSPDGVTEDGKVKFWRKVKYQAGDEQRTATLIEDWQLGDLNTNNPNYISKLFMGFAYEPRALKDVLQLLCTKDDLGLTVKSEFFQWNPDNISSINYVTNEPNVWNNLCVHSKSSIRNVLGVHLFYQFNTIYVISLKDLLSNLCDLFNLKYKIEGDNLRIEHVSYFSGIKGLDLTTLTYSKLLNGRNSYKYDSTQLPKYEKFSNKESKQTDFVGVDIRYESACVNNRIESNKEYKVEFIGTDLFSFLLDRDNIGSDVNCLLLTATIGNTGQIYEKLHGELSSEAVINYPLSWAYLHDKLWKHERVLHKGIMNNKITDFKSIKATKVQDQFNFILCSEDFFQFDPYKRLKTQIGWGIIKAAEFDLFRNTIQLNLKHE